MTIKFAIYTCPPIPSNPSGPDPSSEDSGLWSPLSCTLIYTLTSALIVDCPPSIAATTELGLWIKSILPADCSLRFFVASHAHGDHFFGVPVLQDMFPGMTSTATERVVAGISEQYSSPFYENFWGPIFPPSHAGTGMPGAKAHFVPLPPSNEFELDGHLIKLYDVPHGDTHANSFVHVPELDLVVAGDLVYNGDCHQYLGEACTQQKRKQWIEGLAQIMALKPKIVVPGHTFTPASQPDEVVAINMLEGTKAYIKGFEEELEKAGSEEELFQKMRARYNRWNLWILQVGCAAGVANKQVSS